MQVFEKRMPYAFAEFFGSFEQTGAVLYPPPACYKYYENKAHRAVKAVGIGLGFRVFLSLKRFEACTASGGSLM